MLLQTCSPCLSIPPGKTTGWRVNCWFLVNLPFGKLLGPEEFLWFFPKAFIVTSCVHCDQLWTLWPAVNIMIASEHCDPLWTLWPLVDIVTSCEHYEHLWTLWPEVNIVTSCEHCNQRWTLWPEVNIVTSCEYCDQLWTLSLLLFPHFESCSLPIQQLFFKELSLRQGARYAQKSNKKNAKCL